MPFEHKVLNGPRSVNIQGPTEHQGESRYSWIEQDPGNLKIHAMILRIEKLRGFKSEYDRQSPIVSLQFLPGGLWISLRSSTAVPQYSPVLNPYTNAIAERAPIFIIGRKHWRTNRVYAVQIASNSWGDFLIFEEIPQHNKHLLHASQRLMINLWAVFGLAGLHEVRSDGGVYFARKRIGQVPTKLGICLPFFGDVSTGTRNPMTIFWEFQRESALRAYKLVRGEGASANDMPIRMFDVIGESVFGDRSTRQLADGVKAAKDHFTKIFPEA